jgi:hypothetical protein
MSETKSQSLLLGNAALAIWGDVDSNHVDEPALNDWWTNEHLPERLSIPGFLRARRYYCARGESPSQTKYFTFYEVSDLEVLTSTAYMEKLNNPTKGTQQHVPTLATMQRSACKVVYSEVRRDLRTCSTGLSGTVAMFVLEVPPRMKMERGLQVSLPEAFAKIQNSDKTAMNLIILEEDKNATEPGSSSQSYQNVKLQPDKYGIKKWIVLLEFSSPAGLLRQSIETSLKPLKVELENLGGVTCDVYEFICSVRA